MHYSILIEWEPQGGVFVATVRELPGCVTFGKTCEDALVQVEDAMDGWIAIAQQQHETLPEPMVYDLSA